MCFCVSGFFFVCVYLGFILVYFSLFLIFSLDGDFWLVIISVCFGFFFVCGIGGRSMSSDDLRRYVLGFSFVNEIENVIVPPFLTIFFVNVMGI